MIFDDDPPKSDTRAIVVAVVTAALTTLATGLVTWAIDEMKERRKSPPDP